MFLVAVLLIVLVSKFTTDALKSLAAYDLHYCYAVLIVGAIILPSLYLRSPEDFSWVINASTVCTIFAIMLIVVGISIDSGECGNGQAPRGSDFRLMDAFGGLGSLFFAHGGHAVFPIVQHDMRKPHEFPRSALMSFGRELGPASNEKLQWSAPCTCR